MKLSHTLSFLLASVCCAEQQFPITPRGEQGNLVSTLGKNPFIPVVKSFLSVQIPASLHNHEGEIHHLSRFGMSVDRGSMARYVYYVEEDICEPGVIGGNTTFPHRNKEREWIRPFFLMAIDVGDCTPVRMARNAQAFGASALLLVERFCHCEDKNCTAAHPSEKECYDHELPLIDDGSALDVSIPTAMMRKMAGKNVIKELKNHQPVMMELTWGLPMEESDLPEGEDLSEYKPHYHLWTSAHDPLMKEHTYDHLKALALAFQHSVHFSPRFYIMDGKHFGCTKSPDSDDKSNKGTCEHLCTNHGRYCAPHAVHVGGRHIIEETLRRICIYTHHPAYPEEHHKKHKPKMNTAFYDYSMYHIEHCSDPLKFHDEACIDAAYKFAYVDKAAVEMCMSDTGNMESDEPNSLLDEMLEQQQFSDVVTIPSTLIKNGPEVRSLYTKDIFHEICEKFWVAASHAPFENSGKLKVDVPEICDVCGACPNVVGCLKKGYCVAWGSNGYHMSSSSSSQGGHGWLVTFLVFLLAIACAAYYYYKKRENFGVSGYGLLDGYTQMTAA